MIRITVDEENVRVERKGNALECFHDMVSAACIITKYLADDLKIPKEKAALELYQLIAKIISDPENEIQEVK